MKTLKFWIIATGMLLNFANIEITNANNPSKTSYKKACDRKSTTGKSLISTYDALQDFKLYLNKQNAMHNLRLSQKQIEGFIKQSRSLIYEDSRDGKISQGNSRKIQKNFKLYLKTTYPDKFKPKRSKNEVCYKLARCRIRATTKDFIAGKLQIKNIPEINDYWASVKELIYKKLDKAAYFNDFNELVVDECAIVEIISKVFEKLESKKLDKETKNPNDIKEHKHKHKAVVPAKISQPIAEKLVRLMIRNKGISAKQNETLTQKIMKQVNKKMKKGRVEKDVVIEITTKEIQNFLKLKNKITKKPQQRYLDRFIAAMGKTPETDTN